jgi:hypothetical protein
MNFALLFKYWWVICLIVLLGTILNKEGSLRREQAQVDQKNEHCLRQQLASLPQKIQEEFFTRGFNTAPVIRQIRANCGLVP